MPNPLLACDRKSIPYFGLIGPTTIRLELPPMRRATATLLLLCAACAGQVPAPIPGSEVPQRKEILRNDRVRVSLLELAPGEATPMLQHDRDMLAVFVNGGRTLTQCLGTSRQQTTSRLAKRGFTRRATPTPSRTKGRARSGS